MIVWINGAFTDESEAAVSLSDRGLTLGDGVFDTMLAVDGAPVDAAAHIARLRAHCAVLRLPPPDALSTELIAALLQENGFTQGRFAVRTTVTGGPGARGLAPPDDPAPTVFLRASPAPAPGAPVRMIVAQTVRRNEYSPLSRIKSLNYGDNILALMEARGAGADDAVLLNGAGRVCCASAANIFIREGERILTPPLSDGVLDGTVRARLLAEEQAIEESLTPDRLHAAAAVFLTNSVQGVRPVTQIDERIFKENRTASTKTPQHIRGASSLRQTSSI